jgi:peroxiredoxin (alkyl hydroperoxide reductase subunit C)
MYDIYLRTGIKIPFPIIADRNGTIARKYGMISNDISNTQTVRNVYIIDPEGIIRLILIYPMNIGRCIPEILRSLEALQIADKCKGSTPANWTLGNPIINHIPQTFNELEKKSEMVKNEKNGMSWYLSFKNPEDCKQNTIQKTEIKKLEDKKNTK